MKNLRLAQWEIDSFCFHNYILLLLSMFQNVKSLFSRQLNYQLEHQSIDNGKFAVIYYKNTDCIGGGQYLGKNNKTQMFRFDSVKYHLFTKVMSISR